MANEIPTNVPNIPAYEGLCKWSPERALPFARQATVLQNNFYAINAGVKYLEINSNEEIEAAFLNTFDRPAVVEIAPTFNRQFGIEQRKIAKKMRKMIRKRTVPDENGHVFLNNIYIMALPKENDALKIPVFYFKDKDGNDQYLDLQARVYKDFNDFLENNVIEPALCCYPVNGHYGQTQTTDNPTFNNNIVLNLAIYKSPAGGDLQTLIRFGQTLLKYGAYGLMAASMVTQATSSNWFLKFCNLQKYGPLLKNVVSCVQTGQKCFKYANAAATIASSCFSIKDKLEHTDDCPITEITLIVSTVMDLLSESINEGIVMLGLGEKDIKTATFDDLSWKTRFFLHLFSASRCAASIISLVTVVVTMLYKEKCTPSDYFNLSSSLFTCYGTLTSPLTAEKIFKQVQAEYIQAEIAAAAKQNAKPKPLSKRLSENCDAKADTVAFDNSGNNENGNTEEQSDQTSSQSSKNPNYRDRVGPRSDSPINKEEIDKDYKEIEKKFVKDDNDEAGKEALKYFNDNILSKFKGTDNEYVFKDQIVRLMKQVDDPRLVLCEIALTKTVIDVKDGLLLINGQVRIDGAALGAFKNNGRSNADLRLLDEKNDTNFSTDKKKSVTEDIFYKTKRYHDEKQKLIEKYQNDEKYQKEMDEYSIENQEKTIEEMKKKGCDEYTIKKREAQFKNKRKELEDDFKSEDTVLQNHLQEGEDESFLQSLRSNHRLIFEVDIIKLDEKIEDLGLTDFTINGEKVFQNLTLHEKFRLRQQFDKAPKALHNDLIKATAKIAQECGYTNKEMIAAAHEHLITESIDYWRDVKDKPENQGLEKPDLQKQFFNVFGKDDVLTSKVANNLKLGIEIAELQVINFREIGLSTTVDHRFDYNNEDSKTVAAIAFVHGNKYGKCRKESEFRNFEQQVDATGYYLTKKQDGTHFKALTQDGKSYFARHQKE